MEPSLKKENSMNFVRYFPIQTPITIMEPTKEMVDRFIAETEQREIGTIKIYKGYTYKVTGIKVNSFSIGWPILVAVASLVDYELDENSTVAEILDHIRYYGLGKHNFEEIVPKMLRAICRDDSVDATEEFIEKFDAIDWNWWPNG